MPAQCLREPRELSKGDAGAMGRPQPCPSRQEKEELCPQLCRAEASPSLSSCPFFLFQQVQVLSLHFSAEQHDLAQEPAGSVPLIPGKGRKQRTEAETPTNCIAETFNPKRCIFSQETVTHDLIFPGHKISK